MDQLTAGIAFDIMIKGSANQPPPKFSQQKLWPLLQNYTNKRCLLIEKGIQNKTIYNQLSSLNWSPVSSGSGHFIGVA